MTHTDLTKANATPRVVIALADSCMGGHDLRLGLALLANFLRLLGERDTTTISAIVLYNEGVKLLLADSPTLPHLQALASQGVELIVCRTCVEYFGLEDQLRAGRLGGMAEIQDLMMRHPVVRP